MLDAGERGKLQPRPNAPSTDDRPVTVGRPTFSLARGANSCITPSAGPLFAAPHNQSTLLDDIPAVAVTAPCRCLEASDEGAILIT